MIPVADYDAHPAFSFFCRRRPSDDFFAGMNVITDAFIDEYLRTNERHKELIDKNIDKYDEAVINDTATDRRLRDPIRRAVRQAHQTMIDEKRARATIGIVAPESGLISENFENLYYRGYFQANMPADATEEITKILQPQIDSLRARAEHFGGKITFEDSPHPGAYEPLNKFCREGGVFESLSTYFGRRYSQAGFAIHYSSTHDSWHRVFDDVGLPLAATAQMHFDASYAHPKAMLYLNDVQRHNGAFSLIPRDVPHDNLEFDLAFGKSLLTELHKITSEDFDFPQHGNESAFRCAKTREIFCSLPHSLRRTSHIGDHILNDSLLSKSLLSKELYIEGHAGTMPIFAGSHVLHRGGIVSAGERIALQIVFYPDEAVPPSGNHSVVDTSVEKEKLEDASDEILVDLPGSTEPSIHLPPSKRSFPKRVREALRVLTQAT